MSTGFRAGGAKSIERGIATAHHRQRRVYYAERNWLLLVESVTSHGPIDGKRYAELTQAFANANPGLVFVTAFPDQATKNRYRGEIAWETDVWLADSPSHMIHFDGQRFLGPYSQS